MTSETKRAVVFALAAFSIAALFAYVLVADPLSTAGNPPADEDSDLGFLATPVPPRQTQPTREEVRAEPVDVYERHDYTQSAERRTFTIPEVTGPLSFSIYFERSVGPGLRIAVYDPDGTLWAETTSGSSGVQVGVGRSSAVTHEDIQMAAGEWVVDFTGIGPATGVLEISG